MYRLTAITAIFAAIVHGVIFVLGNFTADVMPMLLFAVVYLYLAFFLFKQRRWMAWSTVIVGVAGLLVALVAAPSDSLQLMRAYNAAAVVNFIAVVCAIVTLWTTRVVNGSSVN